MTSIGHQCKNTLHLSYVKILNQLLYNIHAILWSVCVKCLRIDGHCIRCVWRKFWYSLSSFWIATKMHFDKNRIGRIFLVVKWVFFLFYRTEISSFRPLKMCILSRTLQLCCGFIMRIDLLKLKSSLKIERSFYPWAGCIYNNTHLIF